LRRLATGLLAFLAALVVLSTIGAVGHAQSTDDSTVDPTGAQADDPRSEEPVAAVDVLQVSGFFDEILANEVGAAIDRAVEDGSQALVLQVNSRGTVIDDATVTALLETVADAPLPIGVWIGPSGARFYGTAAQLIAVADVTGMAPGARVGYVGQPLEPDNATVDFRIAEDRLRNGSVGLSDARALDIFKQRIDDEGIPTIANMVQALDGFQTDDGTELVTT
jgi:membrane-bound serine protease (ClpP class)